MSDSDLSKEALLKYLQEIRKHHTEHPQAVSAKAAYTAMTFVTTVVLGIIIGKAQNWTLEEDIVKVMVTYLICLIPFALILIWGLIEHARYHTKARNILDSKIDELLTKEASPDDVVTDLLNEKTDTFNPLAFEPDRRGPLSYHDTKLFGPIIAALFLLIGFLSYLVFCN